MTSQAQCPGRHSTNSPLSWIGKIQEMTYKENVSMKDINQYYILYVKMCSNRVHFLNPALLPKDALLIIQHFMYKSYSGFQK